MANQYDVVFNGQVLPGFNAEEARAAFGKTFKLTPDKIDICFSGKDHVLCKEVNEATAEKYKTTLANFGCAVDLRLLTPKKINFDELSLVPMDGEKQTAEPTVEEAQPAPASVTVAPTEPAVDANQPFTCPKCQTEQTKGVECVSCGIIFEKYFARQQQLAAEVAEPAPAVETTAAAIPMSSADNQAYFFTTSTKKLIVMSICTFGIYELYWFYKNWQLIKMRSGSSIMPFWRAFWAPLWAYSCFKEIDQSAEDYNVIHDVHIGLMALIYFIVSALWRLPDPGWLISYLAFLPMIPMNKIALDVNYSRNGQFKNNDTFTPLNWAMIVIGGIMFGFAIVGAFFPELPADPSPYDY